MSDAKKMSKHGKGQTKFQEATDTVEKDEKGNVKSWKHEGDWKKTNNKQGRGKVTNLSDKARRKTEKMTDKEVAEATVTQGPNKGKQWSPKTPGPTNPNYKPFDKNGIPSPDDGATAPPPKVDKKAEVSVDDKPITAGMKRKGKQVSEGWTHDTLAAELFEHEEEIDYSSGTDSVLKQLRQKQLKESIRVLENLLREEKAKEEKLKREISEDDSYMEKLHSQLSKKLNG